MEAEGERGGGVVGGGGGGGVYGGGRLNEVGSVLI